MQVQPLQQAPDAAAAADAVPAAPDTASISGTGYLVSVRHPLFVPQEDREVTVYARIESILPVMLEPVI